MNTAFAPSTSPACWAAASAARSISSALAVASWTFITERIWAGIFGSMLCNMELSSARAATTATGAGGGRAQAGKTVTSPSGTQAVDRAARLLTEVVHSPGSVPFTELAATTGLAKSTTSPLLLDLERHGVDQLDD